MSERLLSVGLDVGTTSTQLVVSELLVENRASSFAVPELEIAQRKILHRGKVHFTPLLGENLVDGEGVRAIVEMEYGAAGIGPRDVDTGAIIITGETSRKENAKAVLNALSDFAGDFVVATAGPDLESVLAAKGAGADVFSEETGKCVLHMDIGGGTSNLAWIEDGKIVKTGCLNVGGRLLKFDEAGTVTYVSPVLAGLCDLKVGEAASRKQVEAVAAILVQTLEMAAGLREPTALLDKLWTKEHSQRPPCVKGAVSEADWGIGNPSAPAGHLPLHRGGLILSFSGGVADCIEKDVPWLSYGDMGPVLGRKIRESVLCHGEYRLGTETIRATVIGAGCHSAQLSGSTVFCQNIALPLKNLPVFPMEQPNREAIRRELEKQEGNAVLAMPGIPSPNYRRVKEMAEEIATGWTQGPVLICLEQDMAKALGQALALRLGPSAQILCIDRVRLGPESFLDVGAPIGPALPVVVKTLVLGR